MASTTNGGCESITDIIKRVMIEEEDSDDYMPKTFTPWIRDLDSYSEPLPKYTGVQDPIAANMWIYKMELLFDVIECAEGDKLVHAVSMLRSGAKTWWDKIKDTSGPTKMTWTRFKKVFKEEFSPLRMEMELVEKYATIKMGRNERLQDFYSRFKELAWFYMCCLTYEKRVIYTFEKGLNANIKDFIPDKDLISFDKMFAAAKLIEKENNRRLEEMNALDKKMGSLRKQKALQVRQ